MIAALIGLGAELDAYYLTLPLALFIAGGLGAVIETLLIPRLVEHLSQGRDAEVRSLAAAYYSLALLAGLAIAALVGLSAPAFMPLLPGLAPEQRSWFLRGLWLMLPYFALALPMRAAGTLLRVGRRFSVTAQGEFLLTMVALATLCALPRLSGILFISASGGMVVAWLYVSWQAGRAFRLWGNPLYPPLWRELRQMPALTTLKVLQLAQTLLMSLSLTHLAPGALGAYQYAYALVFAWPTILKLPSGFTTEYSEYVSRQESTLPLLRRILSIALGIGALGALLYGAGSEWLVRFALERGAFGPEQTRQTAEALRILSLALPVWLISGILEAVFQVRRRYGFVLALSLLGLGMTAVLMAGALHVGATLTALCAIFVSSLYIVNGWALWGVLRLETESDAVQERGPGSPWPPFLNEAPRRGAWKKRPKDDRKSAPR